VAVAFLVSGAAGLIFQLVWLYRCGLVFGNSVWAAGIVLSSFMAGLALGNALAASLAGRIRRYLLAYAVLEVIVAVTGLGLTYVLPTVTGLLAPLTRSIMDRLWLVNLIRLATAFALLVIPATAMGATLPLLVAALSRWQRQFGRVLGRLYGWNTLGAVIGVVGAELILLRRFGVMGSAWTAALLDLCAAGLVLWVSRRVDEPRAAAAESAPSTVPVALTSRVWRLLACTFLAGGALMALEVVWFRFLTMFVLSTTRAASLMLAVVLAAIGIGALVGSAWLGRRAGVIAWLPVVSVAATCVSVATYGAFQAFTTGAQVSAPPQILWFASVLTFPTALLSGLLFTLIGQALEHEVGDDAKAAGWLMLANTTGAMCGPLVAAFVLLPQLGIERSVFGLSLIYVVVGLLAAGSVAGVPRTHRAPRRVLAAASIAAALLLVFFPFGLMAASYFPRAARPFTAEGETIIATREGTTATIFLTQQPGAGGPIYHRLITNGFSMTGTSLAGKRYMRYFAYAPVFLHETPIRRVLLICYGVGVTADAITNLESVESIDVVEISRDIIAMSDLVYLPDEQPLRDPRVRLHVEDGRYFLQTTGERFDLITGEPPPPLTPGTVNLYTREYFQLMHDRLAEGGIATYWLPVARDVGTDMATIIRAFCDVFPECSLWNGTPSDLMLVGIRGTARRLSEEHFARPWTQAVLGTRLREAGFEVPEQIGATFVGDAAFLTRLAAGSAPLIDDYPYRLWLRRSDVPPDDPRALLDRGGADYERAWITPTRARADFERSPLIRRLWPDALVTRTFPYFDIQRSINRILWEGANPMGYPEELHAVLTRTSLRTLPAWMLGLGNLPFQEPGAESTDNGTGRAEYLRGLRALVTRDYASAVTDLAYSDRRGLGGVRPLLAYTLCLAGRPAEAKQLLPVPLPDHSDLRHFWTWLDSTFRLRTS
jgi:predicted membrane-bound spermidine synthase